MRDQGRLFLALEVNDQTFDQGDFFAVVFDDDNDGVLNTNEDVIIALPFGGLQDGHWDVNGKFLLDTQAQNGLGVASTLGLVKTFELSHPLNSGDPQDIAVHIPLAAVQVVGFVIVYHDDQTQIKPDGGFPVSIGDGQLNQVDINANVVTLGEPIGELLIPPCPNLPAALPPTLTPTPGLAVTIALASPVIGTQEAASEAREEEEEEPNGGAQCGVAAKGGSALAGLGDVMFGGLLLGSLYMWGLRRRRDGR